MELLLGLISLLIYIAIIALVIYVIEWAIKSLFPQAPAKVFQILWVIAVLIGLYLVVAWLIGSIDVTIPVFRRAR